MMTNLASPEWVAETVAMCHEQGYRVTPVFSSKRTKPYADGQTYLAPADYKDAQHIGVVLDKVILLDWDGNKAKADGKDIIPIDAIAAMCELDDFPHPVQENTEGDSLHYLFSIPFTVDVNDLKASNDGGWLDYVDLKTGNQLLHLKQRKAINDSELPASHELTPAPKVLIAMLEANKASESFTIAAQWDGSSGEVEEARYILGHISADCGYQKWLDVLMGVHSKFGCTEEAIKLLDEWSATGPTYCGVNVIRYKLSSFEENGGITFETVCFWARKAGADLSAIKKMFRDDGTKRSGYDKLMKAASALVKDGFDNDEVALLCADARHLSPVEDHRVLSTIKSNTGLPLSTLKTQQKASRGEGKDDPDQLQLAQELVEKVGKKNVIGTDAFVFNWATKGVWEELPDRSIKKRVHDYIPGKVDDVFKSLVDGVTDLFKTEVFQLDHEFDVGPPETVNCINGELSITSDGQWERGPHVREHYRTAQIPVSYSQEASAPKFETFLQQTFEGDIDAADKIKAVLEMMGYTLMAHCRHERFIILVGNGANGKSVLLAVLEALCGTSNVAGVQPSQFSNLFQRAHLHGKLANIVTEVKQGEIIDDASLKGIVSGEPTTVEHKFKNPFVMRPFSTCWFGTNHMPHTRDFSDALFRRALVIPFNNVFKPEMGNCNPHLKDELLQELPGILSLVLTAYSNALKNGFTTPASCNEAGEQWRLEADQVAQFLDDACTKEVGYRSKSQPLYDDYRRWASDQGINKTLSNKSFVERLGRLGFVKGRDRHSVYFLGLKCTYSAGRFRQAGGF